MWPLSFISEEDFSNHVRATIEKYGEKLESFGHRHGGLYARVRNLQGLQHSLKLHRPIKPPPTRL